MPLDEPTMHDWTVEMAHLEACVEDLKENNRRINADLGDQERVLSEARTLLAEGKKLMLGDAAFIWWTRLEKLLR